VLWKDGTSTWVPLKELKESNSVQVADYAVGNKIATERAFNLIGGYMMYSAGKIESYRK
jgi:hypothetical protein